MTQDQAAELLTAVHDLQQQTMALGMLEAQGVIWLQSVCILLLLVMFFLALGRSVR